MSRCLKALLGVGTLEAGLVSRSLHCIEVLPNPADHAQLVVTLLIRQSVVISQTNSNSFKTSIIPLKVHMHGAGWPMAAKTSLSVVNSVDEHTRFGNKGPRDGSSICTCDPCMGHMHGSHVGSMLTGDCAVLHTGCTSRPSCSYCSRCQGPPQ